MREKTSLSSLTAFSCMSKVSRDKLWCEQTVPVPTATVVLPSPRFCVSVVLLSSWLSIKSLDVKYFLTFSPLFPRDPREPRRPSVP